MSAGALEQSDVDEALAAAGMAKGLVRDDGARQTWATIRGGLSKGLLQPIDLDAEDRRLSPKDRGKAITLSTLTVGRLRCHA